MERRLSSQLPERCVGAVPVRLDRSRSVVIATMYELDSYCPRMRAQCHLDPRHSHVSALAL